MTRVLVDFAISWPSTSWIVWSCHVKHYIIEIFEIVFWCTIGTVIRFIVSIVCIIWAKLWILSMDVDKLIILKRHIFFDEVINTFT